MVIKNLNALGLFGGASLNSIDLALINTDGIDVKDLVKTSTIPYPDSLASDIRTLISRRLINFQDLDNDEQVANLKINLAEFYAQSINNFCSDNKADIIGIDGLTVRTDAENTCSYQLEDGKAVSRILNRRIITHFRKADLLAGGTSSPLTPVYISAFAQKLTKPALFIDIEAIAGLIYLGDNGELLAFDCAPGTALIEDWTFRHANMQNDYNGKLAITGKINHNIIDILLRQKILHKKPPKSLDISCFADKKEHLEGLSLEDGAATATYFIAEAIYQASLEFLPTIPSEIYLCGHGLKNPTLVRFIKQTFVPRTVKIISETESIGAQTTAFNAVRRLHTLPITFPSTTGIGEPITGGEFYE